MIRFLAPLLALVSLAGAQSIEIAPPGGNPASVTPLPAEAPAFDFKLPTENDHLYSGPEKFYMYVDRNFEGQLTKPWEGGKFGFVRTPIRINGEVILTKFHEGIDIAPVTRDAAGNPKDPVKVVADGTVVHISPLAGRSNYGKYVVVEHRWENSSVYSLYAHLSVISVKPGDVVKTGDSLGVMGFTGDGIDRTRSHVHLELCFMLSQHFDDWQKANGGGINYQGNFNGMNLSGVDVSEFFLERQKKPALTFPQFVASIPAYFKVAIPATNNLDFVKRYPWIVQGDPSKAVSWEISFSATGHPIAFVPSSRPVVAPIITGVRPSSVPHRYLTRNLVIGEGNQASLSANGLKLISLLTDNFPKTNP